MNVDLTNLAANRKAAAAELRVQAAGHQHRADEMRRQADELDALADRATEEGRGAP